MNFRLSWGGCTLPDPPKMGLRPRMDYGWTQDEFGTKTGRKLFKNHRKSSQNCPKIIENHPKMVQKSSEKYAVRQGGRAPLGEKSRKDDSMLLRFSYSFVFWESSSLLEGTLYVLDYLGSLGLGSPFVLDPVFLWTCSD